MRPILSEADPRGGTIAVPPVIDQRRSPSKSELRTEGAPNRSDARSVAHLLAAKRDARALDAPASSVSEVRQLH